MRGQPSEIIAIQNHVNCIALCRFVFLAQLPMPKMLPNALVESVKAFMRSFLEGYHEARMLRGAHSTVGTIAGLVQASSPELSTVPWLCGSANPDDQRTR